MTDERISVLLVEDDDDVRETTALLLERRGFVVRTAADGIEALEAIAECVPDLVVADVAMPRMDGLTFVRRLRGTSAVPVLLLTARDTAGDVVTGLQSGADDYVTKPWDGDVLVARLQALRRRTAPQNDIVRLGTVGVDRAARAITVNDVPVAVSATEFRLLDALVEADGVVLSRRQLLRSAWRDEEWIDHRVVDTNVQRLRAKLGPGIIETVRGFGYRVGRIP